MTNLKLINRSNPWDNLLSLQNEMDRLFRGVSEGNGQSAGVGPAAFRPPVDVLRGEDSIIVRADVPGLTKDDINLAILNNRLFIRGEKKRTEESGESNGHRLERFYGSFERVIELPVQVNIDAIKASFRDGVLEVTAPVKEEAKPRQIPLEVQ